MNRRLTKAERDANRSRGLSPRGLTYAELENRIHANASPRRRKRQPIKVWNTRDAFNSEASELNRTTSNPEYEADTLLTDLPDDSALLDEPPEAADALRRAFGTRPARPLKPAAQDMLFDRNPQRRLF